MTLTHITSYKMDGEGLLRVNLLDYDPDTGDVSRRGLGARDRIDVSSDADPFPPERFELIGLAEDYLDPATVWAVYEDPDSRKWCSTVVEDYLGDPPRMQIEDVNEQALEDIDADELASELEGEIDE